MRLNAVFQGAQPTGERVWAQRQSFQLLLQVLVYLTGCLQKGPQLLQRPAEGDIGHRRQIIVAFEFNLFPRFRDAPTFGASGETGGQNYPLDQGHDDTSDALIFLATFPPIDKNNNFFPFPPPLSLRIKTDLTKPADWLSTWPPHERTSPEQTHATSLTAMVHVTDFRNSVEGSFGFGGGWILSGRIQAH